MNNDNNSLVRLNQCLIKIQKDSSRKHVALRKALQDALDHLKALQTYQTEDKNAANRFSSQGVPKDPVELDRVANKIVISLRLACETKTSKLMSTALDCMHKMIDYGFLRGAASDEEAPEKKLMAKVIGIISGCFDFPDDAVQLQIIKALLSAVVSPTCDVHETSLLNAIRTCYNIFLVSRNTVNQNTAKGTLTQMLHTIYQRMELKMSPDIVIGAIDESAIEEQLADRTPTPSKKKDLARQSIDPTDSSPAAMAKRLVAEIATSDKADEDREKREAEEAERMQQEEQVEGDDHNSSESSEIQGDAADEPIKATDLEGSIEVIEDIQSEASSKLIASAAASVAEDAPAPQPDPSVNGDVLDKQEAKKSDSSEGYYVFNDCYLIFRALCKLSMKDLPKDATNESIDMKSKVLSLELLLTILESSGPVFRSCDKFINTAIKKYLIISLLTNGVSSNSKVFKLSLSIFLALISYFKDYVKNEIGVFYSKIFLFILESSNSTLAQKWMVLQVLYQICKNPQALVDIFVNYDCSLDSKDIYGGMVDCLSKITRGSHVMDKGNWTPQEEKLKILALECLVTIMKSLVDWSKELRIEKAVVDPFTLPNKSGQNGQNEDKKEKDEEVEDEYEDVRPGLDPNFAKVKERKEKLQVGIHKFKMSFKKGMRYFIDNDLVQDDPSSIAKFLKETEGLDRVAVGEYLGQKNPPFADSVRRCYLETFDVKGLEIDLAIRRFLGAFRIPGEAQQIDRIMERFADHYFSQNIEVGFGNADAVYILSFAIIMLATDLHSVAIKTKIAKAEWVKQQKSLNEGLKDFDENYLAGIYDRIGSAPLALDDGSFDASGDLSTDPKQRKNRFTKEMERTITKSKQMIKEKQRDKVIYYRAKQIEHVRPMFEVVWPPMIAAFSVLLEEMDTPEVIALCLEGFKYAIRVSCTFHLEVERNAFITALAKFTVLNNLREMKPKNVECIKALIDIARTEANYLQDSWLQILSCVSHLEQLHIVGSGKIQMQTSPEEIPKHTHKRTSSSLFLGGHFEQANATMVADQLDSSIQTSIDRIFTSSTQLNSNEIEHFVKCLCRISREEIESGSAEHKMFSLQKLVELAHFNMDRIRLVWTRIWGVLADHFTKVGCDQNSRLAMYAIDSLRQLAMKFLEKNELSNYQFQKEFLKPFEVIMASNSLVKIRQLVIECLANMVKSRAHNIKSGWKSIFVAFTVAASDHDESIVHLAFHTAEQVIQGHFNLIADPFFNDCVNCLVAYGNNHLFIDTSLKAIKAVVQCADHLAQGRVVELQSDENGKQGFYSDNKQHLALWFPILTGLSGIVSHSHIDVRTAAMKALFNILNLYGDLLNDKFWELLFRGVLLPMFDNVQYASKSEILQEDNEWLTTTCLPALNTLVDLFSNYFGKINFLLNDMLSLLSSCILQDNESLARYGSTCLLLMVMTNGLKFTTEHWTIISTRLSGILKLNLPRDVLEVPSETPLPVPTERALLRSSSQTGSFSEISIEDRRNRMIKNGYRATKGKITVQLSLVETVNEVVFTHYSNLETSHLETLLDALKDSLSFSYTVTRNTTLHSKLQKTGLTELLQRLETQVMSSYLRILFRMYSETVDDADLRRQISESRVIPLCHDFLVEYLKVGIDGPDSATKRIMGYTPIIVQILRGLNDLYDDQFLSHLPKFYNLLCDLMLSHHKDIREVLREILSRIGKMKQIS
eukprot:TRINITY_DN3553_c0_g1_i7.p1 TRINITY_DN3553_c0_g1~~TRINITY_DN3553_c0_g1_i7.p1  ORF type:complete len:1701 (-),score=587.09 TRINITY_DN3553_c0_g1_i7:49-5151(-)